MARAALLLALALVGCAPDLPTRRCATATDCFRAERCVALTCQPGPPADAEAADAGARDAAWGDATESLP